MWHHKLLVLQPWYLLVGSQFMLLDTSYWLLRFAFTSHLLRFVKGHCVHRSFIPQPCLYEKIVAQIIRKAPSRYVCYFMLPHLTTMVFITTSPSATRVIAANLAYGQPLCGWIDSYHHSILTSRFLLLNYP
jgi:uncharacterized membrane protein YjgN (DUF898 family)